jgi:hypothetical protein
LNGKEFKPITLKEKKNEEFDGSLTLDYVVEFYASTEWNDDETPIVRDLLMAEKKLLVSSLLFYSDFIFRMKLLA